MLLEKYEPRTSAEILGNQQQIGQVRTWLKNWRKGKGLILSGPTGCGKTLTVRLLAKEINYDVVESAADEDRKKEDFSDLIEMSRQSGFFRKKIILVEDTDVMEGKRYLPELIEKSSHPVVIVAEDPYGISAARLCSVVRMARIPDTTIVNFLDSVVKKEKIEISRTDVEKIARQSSGDIRAALIDLESFTGDLGERKQNRTIQDIIRTVFSNDRTTAQKLLENFSDYNLLFMWICENIGNEYRTAEDRVRAYELLSRADRMASRIIRRQSWSLQKYMADALMSFPNSRRMLSNYRQPFRRKNTEMAEEIAAATHVSKKRAHLYVPLLTS